ncbi:MAG TPA: RES family NAD+ phosphorylase [Bryobacteraceae bacterium]
MVPSKLSTGSVLENLPLPASVIADLTELDAAGNERKIAEAGGSPGIGPGELLYGVPEAHIVNAVFSHPGPYGGRFHGPRRGAWYAGLEVETSIAEVSFHKRRFLENAHITGEYPFDYIDFLADFSGLFHCLDASDLANCLQPNPIPQCYAAPQALAKKLLYEGSNGIVYPSVRNPSGTCLACFRPALIFHPRRADTYRITIQAGKKRLQSNRPRGRAKEPEARHEKPPL